MEEKEVNNLQLSFKDSLSYVKKRVTRKTLVP